MPSPDEFRAARRRKKLTQAQAAEQLGVTWWTISRWERGLTPVPEMTRWWMRRVGRPRKG